MITASSASSAATAVFHNAPFHLIIHRINIANALGLILSLSTKSHVHLDLIGTGAFAYASYPRRLKFLPTAHTFRPNHRTIASSVAVTTWSVKLALFLFYRATHTQHDARLTTTLSNIHGTLFFWMISYLWNVITILPHALGTTSSLEGNKVVQLIGLSLFVIGFVIETFADVQKWKFKLEPRNSGKFCNVGLFRFSQHPNYFGNLLVWFGIFCMNATALIEPVSRSSTVMVFEKRPVTESIQVVMSMVWRARRLLLAMISPMFVWILLSGQANGSITNALEMAQKKYGDSPSYQQYVNDVPLIVPKIHKLW